MTIRQSVALIYAVAALGVATVQFVPGIARAVVPGVLAAPQPIPAGLARDGMAAGVSGHIEFDDLPAYLTDESGAFAGEDNGV